jgi:hypothetical protein
MDKRWRNTGLLVLVIILLVAGWYIFTRPNSAALTGNPDKDKTIAVAKLLASNDINYSDLKIATELFTYSLPQNIANKLKSDSTAPQELKDAVSFDEKQDAIIEKYYSIINANDVTFYCTRLDELDQLKMDSLDVVVEMETYYSKKNLLGVDVNATLMSQRELVNDIDAAESDCFDLAYNLGGSQ